MSRLTFEAVVAAALASWLPGVGPELGAFAAGDQSAPVEAKAIVGKPAPDFSAPDTRGNDRKLSSYRGKFVVLEWNNFGCPFVGKHYNSGNMQQLQKTYTKKGVIWLMVNSSAPGRQGNLPPAELNTILEAKGAAPTAYLLDPQGMVGRMYGAKTTPDMFVIDPKGVLIYAGAIDDRVSTEIEDVKGARNFVREALDEAMSHKPVTIASTKSYGCSVKY